MRQISVTLLLTFFISVLSGQNIEKKKTKFGLTLALNDAHSQIPFIGGADLAIDADGNMISGGKKTNKSSSFSIIPKYKIQNDWLIRFEFGLSQIRLQNKQVTISSGFNTSTSYQPTYDTVTQKIYRYVPGVQWTFFKNNRIESYGGVNTPFIKYSPTIRHTYSEVRDVATDSLIYTDSSNRRIPGGYAIGIGVFIGFNVFLSRNISMGAEFSSAFLHYKIGGESSNITSTHYISSPIETTTYLSNNSYTGNRFSKILSSFNISIWL